MSDILQAPTDASAQALYLNAMLSSPELFGRVNHILRPGYFDGKLADGIKFMQEYFQQNRAVPAIDIFQMKTKLKAEATQLGKADIDQTAKWIAEFCQTQACTEVIKTAIAQGGYFEKNNLHGMVEAMKQAVQIGLMEDFGIDYFENPKERIEAQEDNKNLISTGWKTVDELIGGGVARQELIQFLGVSGGFKSVAMLNMAINMAKQGLNGIYFSLEMGSNRVANRADQIIGQLAASALGRTPGNVIHAIEEFKEKYGCWLMIERMKEGSTCADFEAYCRRLESKKGRKPDYMVGDYLDIMEPVQRGVEGLFLREKYIAQEFRGMGKDHNSLQITGSQLEKHATEKLNNGEKMTQSSVQGSSGKTNTADLQIAIGKTDASLAAGELPFHFTKSRNSDASTKQLTMGFDTQTLEIYDLGSRLPALKKKDSALSMVRPGEKRKVDLDNLTSKFQ